MREALSFLGALAGSLALTPLVMVLARRFRLVAQPSAQRWHSRPTALFGGVAIFGAFLGGVILTVPFHQPEMMLRFAGILTGASLMFLLGLVDDFLHLKPSTKLIGQITAACILVYSGVYFDILGMPMLTIPLTIFWVVGITNAFNLLDNMDGLAAGIAAICALGIFALNAILGIDQSIGLVSLAFAGSLVGFLVFNFNPARIFMGDCGSMMVGFTLAGLSIAGTWEQASHTLLLLVVPVLMLGVPIFDTAFVTITRRLRGQSVSVGGRDHTSHRLVALGLSERKAVILLYGVAAAFGGIAILGLKFDAFVVGIVVILAAVVVLIFGMFLGQGHLYTDITGSSGSQDKKPRGFVYDTFVMHKRRAVEVLIDLSLFAAAFVAAFLFRFDGELDSYSEHLILFALPLVIPVKLVTFWAFGLYRRVWDFVGVHDLMALAKAVVTSSLISIMILWGLTRLEGYSRTVFLLDGLLLLLFAAGTRVLFRVFQETLSREASNARRLLVIGAGHEGALILREVRRDPDLGLKVVGFLDDDPDKWGRKIHGMRILGGTDLLAELSEQDRFDEVVIAIRSLTPEMREDLLGRCRVTGRPTRVMQSIASTFVH